MLYYICSPCQWKLQWKQWIKPNSYVLLGNSIYIKTQLKDVLNVMVNSVIQTTWLCCIWVFCKTGNNSTAEKWSNLGESWQAISEYTTQLFALNCWRTYICNLTWHATSLMIKYNLHLCNKNSLLMSYR